MRSIATAASLMVLALVPAGLVRGAMAGEVTVKAEMVDDRKAVIATVEPVKQLAARARIGGTITELKVKEGDLVESGATVAAVADQKLFLQSQALEARIQSAVAQRDKAQVDYDRVSELQRRGSASQAQLDQGRTNLEVAERNLVALRSDREVILQQMAEGAVLAPSSGRVLKVQGTEGSVVMGGETIATLAEDNYILRLSLPERHARVMRAGDSVLIGARGANDEAGANGHGQAFKSGKVRLVYPEIQGGRVIADVEVEGLGDYFVGERTRVYVTTGQRRALLVPAGALYRRVGVDFVRLASGAEIVVQPGETRGDQVEILSGLHDGDKVVTP